MNARYPLSIHISFHKLHQTYGLEGSTEKVSPCHFHDKDQQGHKFCAMLDLLSECLRYNLGHIHLPKEKGRIVMVCCQHASSSPLLLLSSTHIT